MKIDIIFFIIVTRFPQIKTECNPFRLLFVRSRQHQRCNDLGEDRMRKYESKIKILIE